MCRDWLECIIWRRLETWQSVEIVKKVSMIINNDGKWRLSEITISKIYVFISGTESMRFSRVRYPSQHPPVTGLEEDCSISMSREGCQLLISAGPSQSSQNSGSARGKIFHSWCRVVPLSHSLQRYLLTCFLMLQQLEWFHTRRQCQEDQEGPGGWLFLQLWYGGVWPLDYWSRRCDWRCGEYFSWSGCPSLPSSPLPARQVWDVNMRPGATGPTWPAE